MAGGDALKKIVETLKKCLQSLQKLKKELPEHMQQQADFTSGSISDFFNKLDEGDPDTENKSSIASQLGRAAPRPSPGPTAVAEEDEEEEKEVTITVSPGVLGPNADEDMPGQTHTIDPKAQLNPEFEAAQNILEANAALQQGERLLAEQRQQLTPADPNQAAASGLQNQAIPAAPALLATSNAPGDPTVAASAVPTQSQTQQPAPTASPAAAPTLTAVPPQPAGPGQTLAPNPPAPGQVAIPQPPAPGQKPGLNTQLLQQSQAPDPTLAASQPASATGFTGIDQSDAAEGDGFNVAPEQSNPKKSNKATVAPPAPSPADTAQTKDKKKKHSPLPNLNEGPQLRPPGE